MHVHRWSAQNQSRQAPSAVPPSLSLLGCSQWWWQSGFCPGLLCHLQPAASIVPFFACEFCLLGALWILGDFFPLLYVFSPFGCPRPLPLLEQGEGVRCDLVAILQLSEHGFSCGRSPVLGLSWVLALRGVNSTCPTFIAVNDLGYHCFSLCSVLSSHAFTHIYIHSFFISASISVTTSTSLQCSWVSNHECYHCYTATQW